MKNQHNQRNEDHASAAIGAVDDTSGEATGLAAATVPAAEESQAPCDESHRGFDEAHKQVREMQKSAAQNWEPDTVQFPQSVQSG
jgi:hypothetical protein